MKTANIAPALLLLVSLTLTASVRDVNIYAIVEKVDFEPNEKSPERIKIWGVFTLLYTNQAPVLNGDGPYAPHRGYLYFKLPPGRSEDAAIVAAKREWLDLKSMAGTGQAITFGSWTSGFLGLPSTADSLPREQRRNGFVSVTATDESLRVHTEAEGKTKPITYTMDTGIVKLTDAGTHAILVKQLKEAQSRN